MLTGDKWVATSRVKKFMAQMVKTRDVVPITNHISMNINT